MFSGGGGGFFLGLNLTEGFLSLQVGHNSGECCTIYLKCHLVSFV